MCVLSFSGGVYGACASALSSSLEVLVSHGVLVGSGLGYTWFCCRFVALVVWWEAQVLDWSSLVDYTLCRALVCLEVAE